MAVIFKCSSTAPADENHASWSPNGRYLAYASNENAAFYNIYVMDMRTKQRWQLTDHSANDTTPTWAPEGTEIAFVSNRSGKYRVYKMDINGEKTQSIDQGWGRLGPCLVSRWQMDRIQYTPTGPTCLSLHCIR